jgi:uncharacterized protein YnzC (UPF0291/DUF896 family)
MVIPKRHVKESGLSEEEKKEYAEIKATYVENEYEFIMEPTVKLKSIPEHFHLHVIVAKA